MKKHLALLALAIIPPALASTNWTNGGADSSWNNAANWSSGIPDSTSAVSIATAPSGGIIGVDTGLITNPIASLSLSNSLTSGVNFVAAGVEQLTISSSLANNSAFAVKFSLPVTGAGSAASFATGGGLEFAGGLSLGAAAISVDRSSSLKLGDASSTTLFIQDAVHFAAFTGTGTVDYNHTNLQFDFTQGGQTAGSTWQVFAGRTGSLAGVSLIGDNYSATFTETIPGLWSATTGEQSWTFNSSTGYLTAVPEPSCVGLVTIGFLLTLAVRYRKRRWESSK